MEVCTKDVARISSCRGVSFEVKPDTRNLFGNGITAERQFPCRSLRSYNAYPSFNFHGRSLNQASSHFCDIEIDSNELQEDLESQNIADDAVVQNQLPKPAAKRDSRLSIILLDQGLFTVYKRLFVISIGLNILGLSLAATGHFPYAKRKATLMSIGNILALTLSRSEAFLRLVFWLTVKLFGRPWVPISIKTMITAFLQSLGGIHSGCGVSSIAWLVYALMRALQDRDTPPEVIGIASSILALICLSALAAFPLVRHLHHNVFERTHRFAGWLALLLVWIFVILTVGYRSVSHVEHVEHTYNLRASTIIKAQEFWFTLLITILIVLPWLSVKRVPVKVLAPSGHASIIKFQGGVQAGLLGRISPSPLSEWHAFGIISDGQKEHIILAGAVGDFTKSLVSNPPSDLWIRGVHFAGLPYLINLYRRVVLVATGSGICVFLSFLLQPSSADVCLVWVTKGVEENFGSEIKKMVNGYPKDKVIVHDTTILGRPNVAEMSVEAAKNWEAEVVIVTSNPEGSRDVVKACKAAGISAFGPIWDS